MPINIQPSNEFMIPSEDMVFGLEFKKLGSKRYSSSKTDKESSALPQVHQSPNPKSADKSRSKSGVGPQCSDLKQKAKQDAEGNIRNRETAKRSGNDGDELVKHMSNLPGYLLHNDRVENVQEKAFNVGVLDWSRLENWKHKHIPDDLTSRFTPFNRGESSSRVATKSKSSTSASGREKLDDKKGSRRIRPNNREALPQSSKLPSENVKRFESSRSGSKRIGSEKTRNDNIKRTSDVGNLASNSRPRRISSSVPNENKDDEANQKMEGLQEHTQKKIERNHKFISDMEQRTEKSKSKGVSFSSKKTGSGDCESSQKVNQLPESGFDDSCKHSHSKPSNIVLLYPHDIPDSSSSDDFRLSEFQTSSDENHPESSRSSLSYVSIPEEVYVDNVCPEIALSNRCRSAIDRTSFSGPMQNSVSTDLSMNRSSAISEKSASKINKMSGLQSEAACSEKDVLDNRLSNQSAFNNLIESLDQETAELTSQKRSNPSHNRRFSFSLSRIGRSFSFKEGPAASQFSSKFVSSKSGPVTPESSRRWDNSSKEKANCQNRTRSSPLKRLLDPILKHKASGTDHSGESSQKQNRSTDSTSLRSIGVNESLQDEKSKVSSIQGLLQITIKNGMPLFKFVLNDERKIYAATKNSLSSHEKNDLGCCFTFYIVNEIKKKSGGWMSHGNKEKSCGYAYNVVAQMKSSTSKFTEAVNQNSKRQHMVKEYVLLGVEINQTDQGPPKFIPTMELAAVVFETSCGNSSNEQLHGDNDIMKKGENDSSTVILPGGVHGSPNRGEPSSLIHRWRTGGLCDCGGWDIGCKLLVLREQNLSSNIPRSYKPYQDRFQLFVQEGSENDAPLFTLLPLNNGFYSVEFSSTISHLQAFFISVSLLSCQKQPGSLEMSSMSEETLKEPSSNNNSRRLHGKAPIKYTPIPPLSPVGRV
ncbi:hypothetical protein MtrunA17_Chr4g0008861 [Medicago truncatula]|uniref:DUF3527 domain protein n=1 Tax=Medicago truncatula TaxID=3880 RepID=A0A072UIS7_MEDTR|nr:uncharacterized protein LOC25491542 [Medicago truncatula]XP_024638072.1 uncharacterized protein LOC25491542 [Medicago truncatula]XP_024638073.1 uncharacterized protein LOC25491542 [Medicago truncatula]XP_039688665.1 uncharacterized protein LOC25491542 [Medicago truncatula]KEH28988.1 DUF3527 domain protein [Medicago truncatula]RHN59029.1 hypothetical protein MtrunA17_Chr4g0008861 [Medicago truncatula]